MGAGGAGGTLPGELTVSLRSDPISRLYSTLQWCRTCTLPDCAGGHLVGNWHCTSGWWAASNAALGAGLFGSAEREREWRRSFWRVDGAPLLIRAAPRPWHGQPTRCNVVIPLLTSQPVGHQILLFPAINSHISPRPLLTQFACRICPGSSGYILASCIRAIFYPVVRPPWPPLSLSAAYFTSSESQPGHQADDLDSPVARALHHVDIMVPQRAELTEEVSTVSHVHQR